MASNLEKYEKDLEKLVSKGDCLHLSIFKECGLDEQSDLGESLQEELPNFRFEYQTWYSEALAVIKQLIPHRENDFIELYKKPKNRREMTAENYSIEDCLQTISVTQGSKTIVDAKAAIPRFQQQVAILTSAQSRFESSLFDMEQLLRADLFDSELEAAEELNKKGFVRGAGAIAGVVLEGHLKEVCKNHAIQVRKKNPTINDLAELLKNNATIDIPIWRKIQHLADLRNLCDHKKESEPKKQDVSDLIKGVSEIIKNLF